MVLLSEAAWRQTGDLVECIEHVALAAHPDFQDLFIDGMNFGAPRLHTTGGATAAVMV